RPTFEVAPQAFSIPADGVTPLALSLTNRALAYIAANHTMPVRLVLHLTDPRDGKVTIVKAISLSAAHPRHRPHHPSNQPPVAAPDAYTATAGATLTVSAPGVLGNDSDPDHDFLTAA